MHDSKYPVYCIRDGKIRDGYIIFCDTLNIFNGCDFHGEEDVCKRCKESINAQVWNKKGFFDITEQNPLRP